jgi:hypothetical protein
VLSLEPSLLTAVSVAELYIARSRWDTVIEITNSIPATDYFFGFLLDQRGVAFREKGHIEAAREMFKASRTGGQSRHG